MLQIWFAEFFLLLYIVSSVFCLATIQNLTFPKMIELIPSKFREKSRLTGKRLKFQKIAENHLVERFSFCCSHGPWFESKLQVFFSKDLKITLIFMKIKAPLLPLSNPPPLFDEIWRLRNLTTRGSQDVDDSDWTTTPADSDLETVSTNRRGGTASLSRRRPFHPATSKSKDVRKCHGDLKYIIE